MSELNLKCPADFHGGIQDDWDNEYASMWAQVQSLSHNKMQYRKAWMAAKDELSALRQQLQQAEEENERVRQANLDVMMHFDDMKAEKEKAEARIVFLENSMKNAIGWIDGDLRDIIRDVGNQICSYNDLYESADRIEHLLAEALRQQAAESENG